MEREEKREWGEWEGVGRRGGNGNYYNLINLEKNKKQKEMSKEMDEKYNKKFEEISKSLNDTLRNQEKTIKQVMETLQEMKTEMETMKKTQTENRLDMENLGKRTETTESRITNRIQEIEEQISDSEDTIENKCSGQRKRQIQQILFTKHSGNLGHNKKNKSKNNRD